MKAEIVNELTRNGCLYVFVLVNSCENAQIHNQIVLMLLIVVQQWFFQVCLWSFFEFLLVQLQFASYIVEHDDCVFHSFHYNYLDLL